MDTGAKRLLGAIVIVGALGGVAAWTQSLESKRTVKLYYEACIDGNAATPEICKKLATQASLPSNRTSDNEQIGEAASRLQAYCENTKDC